MASLPKSREGPEASKEKPSTSEDVVPQPRGIEGSAEKAKPRTRLPDAPLRPARTEETPQGHKRNKNETRTRMASKRKYKVLKSPASSLSQRGKRRRKESISELRIRSSDSDNKASEESIHPPILNPSSIQQECKNAKKRFHLDITTIINSQRGRQ